MARREGSRRPAENRLIVEVWGWKSSVEPRVPSPILKIGLMITAKAAGRLFLKIDKDMVIKQLKVMFETESDRDLFLDKYLKLDE